jgi:hypothetical protein
MNDTNGKIIANASSDQFMPLDLPVGGLCFDLIIEGSRVGPFLTFGALSNLKKRLQLRGVEIVPYYFERGGFVMSKTIAYRLSRTQK